MKDIISINEFNTEKINEILQKAEELEKLDTAKKHE